MQILRRFIKKKLKKLKIYRSGKLTWLESNYSHSYYTLKVCIISEAIREIGW